MIGNQVGKPRESLNFSLDRHIQEAIRQDNSQIVLFRAYEKNT